jgi:hypothetical protein
MSPCRAGIYTSVRIAPLRHCTPLKTLTVGAPEVNKDDGLAAQRQGLHRPGCGLGASAPGRHPVLHFRRSCRHPRLRREHRPLHGEGRRHWQAAPRAGPSHRRLPVLLDVLSDCLRRRVRRHRSHCASRSPSRFGGSARQSAALPRPANEIGFSATARSASPLTRNLRVVEREATLWANASMSF